jgi:hypothetical protein
MRFPPRVRGRFNQKLCTGDAGRSGIARAAVDAVWTERESKHMTVSTFTLKPSGSKPAMQRLALRNPRSCAAPIPEDRHACGDRLP